MIDSSIALGVKPFQIESQANNLANFLKLQDLQQSGQLNALKMQEAQRGIEKSNRLESLFSGMTGTEKPDDIAKRLLQGGFLKESSDYQKNNRENLMNAAKQRESELNASQKSNEMAGSVFGAIKLDPTPENVQAGLSYLQSKGVLKPDELELFRSQYAKADTPEMISKLAGLHHMSAVPAKDQVLKTETKNTGATTDTLSTNPFTGEVKVVHSLPNTQSPDNAATTATSRANNAATVAAAIRGQNMQDVRENLVPLETPTGYQAFSKKTGTSVPIMSGGQQVQQKDSPLVANQKLQGQLGAGIEEARKLIPLATASGAGALADTAMGFVGKSTAGGDAAQQLETLAGWMTSNVPRMQGPQSDKDVLLYKTMAAEVGNRNKPVSARMAALDTLEKLQSKYADINGTTNNMSPRIPSAPKAVNWGDLK